MFNIETELWSHQKKATEWLMENGSGILDMEMGTGKTLTTLKYIEQIYGKKILIIAPKKAIIGNDPPWKHDLREHTNGEYLYLNYKEGTVKERAKRIYENYQEATNQSVFVAVNYTAGLDYEDMRATLKHCDWDAVVFDEIHELKNPEGKRARQAYLIAKDVPHRIGLTGTPMSNGILDLYQQLMIVRGKPYNNLSWWKDTFTDQDHWGNVKGYKNENKAKDILFNHSFQVGEDVLDLPDYTETKKYCSLSVDRKQKHDEEWKKVKRWITSDEADEEDIRSSIITCQQLANGPAKFKLFEEIYSTIDEPIFVYTKFHDVLDKISQICDNYYEISGRKDNRDEWDDGGVLGGQIQAAKQSIDLTKTPYCIAFEPTYSYENLRQIRKRVRRPGQDKEVRYITLVAEGTVDEKALQAQKNKTNLVNQVVG